MTQAQIDVQKVVRRAFFDSIEDEMDKHPVNSADWLVKLHYELAQRFKAILPSKQRDIDARLDTDLFEQQLKAGAYGSEQMGPLIEYTWALLRMACAPDMDKDVQAAYEEVAGALVPGAAFSKVVPLYLRHAHMQLDEIIDRIQMLHKGEGGVAGM